MEALGLSQVKTPIHKQILDLIYTEDSSQLK